ncbi:hypothetical protein [Pseudomonas phage vB_Pae-PA152]|nr:hypothetical protein [Pseudomonas phage vB_Pae-PA152]
MAEDNTVEEAWLLLWSLHDKYTKEGLSNPNLQLGDLDDGPFYEDYDEGTEEPACSGNA